MHTFHTVEDYLEIIAGKKHLPGTPNNGLSWFGAFDPIISLARYDVQFLDSVTDATMAGTALSSKQAELACKILLKYRRQLQSKNIDVTPVEHPKYRHSLRYVDQTKSIRLIDDQLVMQFPFNKDMIDDIRNGAKQSQGSIRWNRDQRAWVASPTEYNINWMIGYGSGKGFEIDSSVQDRMKEILSVEEQGYEIQLRINQDGSLVIDNAPSSLLEYVQDLLDKQDLVGLVDMSGILGYTVEPDIEAAIIKEYGIQFYMNLQSRWRHLPEANEDFAKSVVEYALQVNRLPVYVYDPSAADSWQFYSKLLPPDQILKVGNAKELKEINPEVKLIWSHKPVRSHSRIPVLISYVGLLIGGEKNYMIQNADKVFFCCAEVLKK